MTRELLAESRRLLVTHASGYVGSRLVWALRERGEPVRCLARGPGEAAAPVPPGTEVMPGDMLDPAALDAALQGVHTVIHLAHSMDSTGHFREQERRAAENLARAAHRAGVRRIVYLGVLGTAAGVSPHVASRQEVGRVLRRSRVLTVELRAPNVLGPGSVAFEMLQALVERQRLLVAHSWLDRLTQPIGIDDLLAYLVAAIRVRTPGSVVVEIGGGEQVTYRQLIQEYARQHGLRRYFIPMPLAAPHLSTAVIALLTPLSLRAARRLIDSIRGETVVASPLAGELFPEIRPAGIAVIVARASTPAAGNAASDAATRRSVLTGHESRTRRVDARSIHVPVPAARAFEPIRAIGGDRGWYFGNWLWMIRGELDHLVGGPGLRRGRRSPDELAPGDPVDFWRVEAFEPDRLLRLRAEMRVPGRAWLQFEVQPADDGGATISQVALFDPAGLPGLLYWYTLLPLHGFIFAGMLRRIGAAALADHADSTD